MIQALTFFGLLFAAIITAIVKAVIYSVLGVSAFILLGVLMLVPSVVSFVRMEDRDH